MARNSFGVVGLALVAFFMMGSMQAMAAGPVAMPTNVLFIIDSSGSMWERVDELSKTELAKKTMTDVLNSLPADSRIGLMSYGHRRKADCGDIELISPIGSETPAAIAKKVNTLKPRGITPIADALKQSAAVFAGVSGPKMIVLITDGGEECNGDPCAAARDLANNGLLVKVNVVGFHLEQKKRSEVECIAKEGKGRYFDVQDKQALFKAMTEVKKEIEKPVAQAESPQAVTTTTSSTPSPMVTTSSTVAVAPVPTKELNVAVPPPPSAARPDDVNLLLPQEGGKIVTAAKAGWENTVNGRDRSSIWMWTGQEVVFGFKDDKPARFTRFAIGIPGTQPQNVKEFEVLVADDSPDGPYRLVGHYRTQNALQKTFYQEFSFNPVSGKYVKFRLISNYGYEMQGWGNTQVYQLKLMGSVVK